MEEDGQEDRRWEYTNKDRVLINLGLLMEMRYESFNITNKGAVGCFKGITASFA
jgi:hypothetical protein